MNPYDIFFNICLGLFIGGLIFSFISIFLAQMESQSIGTEVDTELDLDAEIDIDADVDIDVDVDYDYDPGAEIDTEIDLEADMDVGVEVDTDVDIDSDIEFDIESEVDLSDSETFGTTTTPAPIMLLISAFLLIFGISGIASYYFLPIYLKFFNFIIPPILGFLASKYLNIIWKKIAKSRYYLISSTQNLIGISGEVILPVDKRGGVIKIQTNTPMKQEKMHVKPLNEDSEFERGTIVYIVDIKGQSLLVDSNINKIYKKRGRNLENKLHEIEN
ncbi:MAG: hypothetical protein EU533_01165 [Promethearchaeota archaeon]|nr:MAG: hypothetical protein EU533_01165 [Candidatus Lokiarchaeota archaeon]